LTNAARESAIASMVLGFSIGGYVAQSFVLSPPHLVRRLVLAGTGPRNGEARKNLRVFGKLPGNPVPVCRGFSVSLLLAFGSRSSRRKGILGAASISAGMLIRLGRFRQ